MKRKLDKVWPIVFIVIAAVLLYINFHRDPDPTPNPTPTAAPTVQVSPTAVPTAAPSATPCAAPVTLPQSTPGARAASDVNPAGGGTWGGLTDKDEIASFRAVYGDNWQIEWRRQHQQTC